MSPFPRTVQLLAIAGVFGVCFGLAFAMFYPHVRRNARPEDADPVLRAVRENRQA